MQGFIYIWFDRKHPRFYIGSHFGAIDDGYICSSSWMKAALKRRPHDFRRKIIQFVDRDKLLEAEQKWLDLIKEEELGKRYYNLKKQANGGFSKSAQKAAREYRLGRPLSEEHKKKISEAHAGKPWPKARRKAEATADYSGRRNNPNFGKGKLGTITPLSVKKKISAAMKKPWSEARRAAQQKKSNVN